uniref:Transmembrane protein n=1 Tax=Glossina austeni TaxID=7395 RepID=A0A1A9VNZ8_GLOAU
MQSYEKIIKSHVLTFSPYPFASKGKQQICIKCEEAFSTREWETCLKNFKANMCTEASAGQKEKEEEDDDDDDDDEPGKDIKCKKNFKQSFSRCVLMCFGFVSTSPHKHTIQFFASCGFVVVDVAVNLTVSTSVLLTSAPSLSSAATNCFVSAGTFVRYVPILVQLADVRASHLVVHRFGPQSEAAIVFATILVFVATVEVLFPWVLVAAVVVGLMVVDKCCDEGKRV